MGIGNLNVRKPSGILWQPFAECRLAVKHMAEDLNDVLIFVYRVESRVFPD